MTLDQSNQPRPGPILRAIHALPVLGIIARDIAKSSENIFYALMILVTLVVVAVKIWGIAALAMAALACVPVMFAVLVLITRG
ncbi:MAG: hypothetical protein U1D06_04665 [Paracoccaceae bacterium]|nr:hypothetical protein [Paracoccaceae bacterium]